MATAPTPRTSAAARRAVRSSLPASASPKAWWTREVPRFYTLPAGLAVIALVAACNGMFTSSQTAEAVPVARTAPQNTPN